MPAAGDPRTAAALAALLLVLGGCRNGQGPPELGVFDQRVRAYVALHRRIETELPDLAPAADAAAIDARRQLLAKRLGAAPELQPSGIFTPEVTTVIRARLRSVLDGPDGPNLRGVILDANPDGVEVVPGTPYPPAAPLSTVPAAVLAVLPPLPESLEYRFVDHDLILRDVPANLVVDVMPEAFA